MHRKGDKGAEAYHVHSGNLFDPHRHHHSLSQSYHDSSYRKDQANQDIHRLFHVSVKGSEVWRGEACLFEVQNRSPAMQGLWRWTDMARMQGAQRGAANATLKWL